MLVEEVAHPTEEEVEVGAQMEETVAKPASIHFERTDEEAEAEQRYAESVMDEVAAVVVMPILVRDASERISSERKFANKHRLSGRTFASAGDRDSRGFGDRDSRGSSGDGVCDGGIHRYGGPADSSLATEASYDIIAVTHPPFPAA